jgi:hypothetical protein
MSDEASGYSLGPEARVIVHRRNKGKYSVAVVLREGPFTLDAARELADTFREICGGWATKARVAEMLGCSQKQVDHLREAGDLSWERDDTDRVMIDLASVRELIALREAGNA